MSALEIPTPCEIVEDSQGFSNIHHPREDDGSCTGDLVATCFQDERHAAMLRAAPELLAALEDMLSGWRYVRAMHGDLPGIGWDRCETSATAAIASARGAA